MNVYNTYIKALTLPVSDAAGVTRIEALRAFMVSSSKALAALPKYVLGGKYNLVPYLEIPDKDTTEFKVKGLDLQKTRFFTIANITDETKEDAVPELDSALDIAIAGQAIIKLEEELSKKLLALTQAGSGPIDPATAISTIGTFDSKILALPGDVLVFTSHANYLNMHNTMSSVQWRVLEDKLIPMHGLADTDMVVIHTAGAAIGYELKDVEEDRKPETGEDILVSTANFAFDVADGYHARILLS